MLLKLYPTNFDHDVLNSVVWTGKKDLEKVMQERPEGNGRASPGSCLRGGRPAEGTAGAKALRKDKYPIEGWML